MPGLDVSFVLADPLLSDVFDVERREEVISRYGRTTIKKTLIKGCRGVVTQQDPAQLMRDDAGQSVPDAIEINSTFRFREASVGFQPDRVLWDGRRYLVKKIYPWSRFGKGHSRVALESVEATDPVTAGNQT